MKKGCKYCRKDFSKDGSEAIICESFPNEKSLELLNSLYIEGNGDLVSILDCGDFRSQVETKINYCPMCGTNLKELYKDEE